MLFSLQDLEEETVKLRESKKPVTDRAQMLLQALSVRRIHTYNVDSSSCRAPLCVNACTLYMYSCISNVCSMLLSAASDGVYEQQRGGSATAHSYSILCECCVISSQWCMWCGCNEILLCVDAKASDFSALLTD